MNRFTRWVEEGKACLRAVGVRGGLTVLDFGCGSGNYTIPVAELVGATGRVYAVDQDRWKLRALMERAESRGLTNIEDIETAGDVRIPLADETVDVVLLYDVVHHYYFTAAERHALLREVYRVAKPHALISVYPKHIELHELTEAMDAAQFSLRNTCTLTLLVHDDNLEEGEVYNFTKEEKQDPIRAG